MPRNYIPSVKDSLTVRERLLHYGIDPIKELVRLYKKTTINEKGEQVRLLSPKERMNLLLELLTYEHPKLRVSEHKGTVDHNIAVFIRQIDGKEVKVIEAETPQQIAENITHDEESEEPQKEPEESEE